MRLANLAVKVGDLDAVAEVIDRLPGMRIATEHELGPGSFIELRAGDSVVNVFERLLYESDTEPVAPGLVHASYFVDDLDVALADPDWSALKIWGPEEISGSFGTRRIAFFEPSPGVRIELMQELP